MKICIVGAGAIGGILAARLSATGHDVSVIARGPHLAAIRRDGLVLVDHLNGSERSVFKIEADAEASALAERVGTQDVVFLASKANGLHQLVPRLGPLLRDDTMVVPAINGLPWWYFAHELGANEGRSVEAVDLGGALLAALPSSHLIGCVVHLAGEVRAPGEIHHTAGRRLLIGEIDRRLAQPMSERVLKLAGILQTAGLDTAVTPDIRLEVWSKLIGNLSFNPVAALTGCLMDEICNDPGLVAVLVPMIEEGSAVALALGITIPMNAMQRIDIARKLGRARISMLQDFEAGRTPELGAIVASVIELAGWMDVAVPTVKLVYGLACARARHLGIFGT
jgi:2-dehydropantoate 2-reductase